MKKNLCIISFFVSLYIFCFSACLRQNHKPTKIEAITLNSKPFLGIAFEGITELEKQTNDEFSNGIKIVNVLYGTAARKAGLRRNDIILAYDSKKVAKKDVKKITKDFQAYIQNQKQIGEEMVLTILRQKTIIACHSNKRDVDCRNIEKLQNLLDSQPHDEKIDFSIENKADVKIFSVTLGAKPNFHGSPPPKNKALFPEFEQLNPFYAKHIQQIINDHHLDTQYADLIKQYAEDECVEHGFRLNLVRYVRRDPLRLPVVADIRTTLIEAMAKNYDIKGLIQEAAITIDAEIPDEFENQRLEPPLSDTQDAEPFINYAKRVINASLKHRDTAFQSLTPDEVTFLESHLPEFVNHFVEGSDISESDNESLVSNNMETIRIARNVNYPELLYSAWILAGLVDPEFLDGLNRAIHNNNPSTNIALDGVTGEVLYAEETSLGWIIIGGPGTNHYTINAAAIFDTGGDDIYTGKAGAADKNTPISILIDFNGNDHYTSTGFISMGSGNFGTGILLDMEGDDIYTGLRFSQGTGLIGAGILVDLKGNDTYEGQECCQGMALWGCGILLDYNGNDNYSSALYSQGVGMTKGNGILWDNRGNDTFLALGKYPSSYGTNGIFDGLSQGFGVGFRNYASGGIGMLIDSAGQDAFRAGNFSQGCGYYFGLGILKNSGKGNDTYIASRYGQGAAAHSAAGILIDEGGNDRYTGLKGALQAAAWDLSTAALIDYSGDDVYDTALLFFSQPAAAHNGFSMLIDSSGTDTYNFPNQLKMVTTEDNKDNDFSFLIDFGGAVDFYNNDPAINNTTTVYSGNKVIADIDR